MVPNKQIVEEFFSAVSECPEPESSLIGVHCTHGLNRTGYLVCRWMMEKAGLEPDTAITAFNTARGHEQERGNYLEHLRTKGWETETETGYKKLRLDEAAVRGLQDRYKSRQQRDFHQGGHQDRHGSYNYYNDNEILKLCIKLNICDVCTDSISERKICKTEVWIQDLPLLPEMTLTRSSSGPSGVAEYRRKWMRRFSTSCS